MFKPIIVTSLILSLSACHVIYSPFPDDWEWEGPRPLTGTRNFPSASTPYGKGFRDGCQSGFKAVAKGLITDIQSGKFDYRRFKKSQYYNSGWWDGFEQCTYILDNDVV